MSIDGMTANCLTLFNVNYYDMFRRKTLIYDLFFDLRIKLKKCEQK